MPPLIHFRRRPPRKRAAAKNQRKPGHRTAPEACDQEGAGGSGEQPAFSVPIQTILAAVPDAFVAAVQLEVTCHRHLHAGGVQRKCPRLHTRQLSFLTGFPTEPRQRRYRFWFAKRQEINGLSLASTTRRWFRKDYGRCTQTDDAARAWHPRCSSARNNHSIM